MESVVIQSVVMESLVMIETVLWVLLIRGINNVAVAIVDAMRTIIKLGKYVIEITVRFKMKRNNTSRRLA